MSIINQMLKDLEQRRAPGTEHRDRVLEGLRPAATRQGSGTARVLGMLAVVLLSGAAVLWLVQSGGQAPEMYSTVASAPAPAATGGGRTEQAATVPETATTLAQSVKAAVQEGQRQNEFDVPVRPMSESPTPSDAEQRAPKEPVEQEVAVLLTVSDERVAESSNGAVALKSSAYPTAVRSDSQGASGRPHSRREGRHTEGLPARDLQPAAADVLKMSAADSAGHVSSPKQAELHVEKKLREPSAAERTDAIYYEGAEKLRAGQRAQAEARWREALALDAGHLRVREALAGLLIAEGRGGEAGALLDEGLQVAPAHALFAKLRARLLLDEGNVAQALAVLEQHQPGTAVDPEYHAFGAALHQRVGQYAQAVAAYRRALAERPQEAVWWMGLAIALEGAGNNREALGAYRRALAGGPLASALVHYIEGRVAALEQRQVDA